MLRVLPPDQVLRFAQVHDDRLWQCFCALLGIPPDQCDRTAANNSTLPLSLGGLGLRSAVRTSPANWASWADTLPMIHQRHRVVVEAMVSWLNRQVDVPCLRAAAIVADQTGVDGFSPPSWEVLSVMSDSEKAMLRSQGGCGAGAAFSTSPNCALTRIENPFLPHFALASLAPPSLFDPA